MLIRNWIPVSPPTFDSNFTVKDNAEILKGKKGRSGINRDNQMMPAYTRDHTDIVFFVRGTTLALPAISRVNFA